jgi:hypothetical protein
MSNNTETAVKINVNLGHNVQVELTKVNQKRGRHGTREVFLPDASTLSLDGLKHFAPVVGMENLLRKIYTEVIRPVFADASEEALQDDGTVNEAKLAALVRDGFQPTARKTSGPSKSDLEKERNEFILAHQEIMDAVTELIGRGELPVGELRMKFMRFQAELKELDVKIEKKTRKAKAA